jgi:hypothetical protein
MKDIVIFMLVVIVAFLVWNSRVSKYSAPVEQTGNLPVPPDVIQAIIEKVQQTKPDEYPLETIFVTPQADGSYSSRFMFFNTKLFSGAQYDIKAKVGPDGVVDILSTEPTSKIDTTTGYKPDTYKPYSDVSAGMPATPVVTDMRLNTRS